LLHSAIVILLLSGNEQTKVIHCPAQTDENKSHVVV